MNKDQIESKIGVYIRVRPERESESCLEVKDENYGVINGNFSIKLFSSQRFRKKKIQL